MYKKRLSRHKNINSNNTLASKALKIIASIIRSIIPIILLTAPYAYAVVDLNAGAKEFFDPVLKVITDYASTAIFAGGIIGAVVAPGDLRARFGAAAGGMAVGGLVVLAAKKMLSIA